MAAAQLFAAACAAEPSIPTRLAEGHFVPLVGWLRVNLHARGSILSTDELLLAATSKPLEVATYRNHLRLRYLGKA